MKWIGGILFSTVAVLGSIVLANAIATRAFNTRPVGEWGAKTA